MVSTANDVRIQIVRDYRNLVFFDCRENSKRDLVVELLGLNPEYTPSDDLAKKYRVFSLPLSQFLVEIGVLESIVSQQSSVSSHNGRIIGGYDDSLQVNLDAGKYIQGQIEKFLKHVTRPAGAKSYTSQQ